MHYFLIPIGASNVFGVVHVTNLPIVGGHAIQIATRAAAFLLIFAIFVILFKLIPNTKTFWRHIWPGALFIAVFIEIGSMADNNGPETESY